MNLLADESVDGPIVNRLRADGHSVSYVAELDPSLDDDAILRRANQNQSLLVTADRDFGELVFRLGRVHLGVVLVRLAGLSSETKANTVSRVLAEKGDEMFSAFSVISPGRLRLRRPALTP